MKDQVAYDQALALAQLVLGNLYPAYVCISLSVLPIIADNRFEIFSHRIVMTLISPYTSARFPLHSSAYTAAPVPYSSTTFRRSINPTPSIYNGRLSAFRHTEYH